MFIALHSGVYAAILIMQLISEKCGTRDRFGFSLPALLCMRLLVPSILSKICSPSYGRYRYLIIFKVCVAMPSADPHLSTKHMFVPCHWSAMDRSYPLHSKKIPRDPGERRILTFLLIRRQIDFLSRGKNLHKAQQEPTVKVKRHEHGCRSPNKGRMHELLPKHKIESSLLLANKSSPIKHT